MSLENGYCVAISKLSKVFKEISCLKIEAIVANTYLVKYRFVVTLDNSDIQ